MEYEDVAENFWEPKEKGDSVAGRLVQIQREAGQNKSMLYSVELEDKSISLVWGSIVLDNKMSAIVKGNNIKIIYLGMKPGEREYKDYKVQRAVAQD